MNVCIMEPNWLMSMMNLPILFPRAFLSFPLPFSDEFPQLIPLINRKFESTGDIEETLALVQQSKGVRRTRDLAQV